jgi:hypothetical protein
MQNSHKNTKATPQTATMSFPTSPISSSPEVPPELQALDESLRCGICQELYNNAVTISISECAHTFCSLCIRKTFFDQMKGTKRKAWCPKCNCDVPRQDKEIITNREIQAAVLGYKQFLVTYNTTRPEAAAPEAAKSPSPNTRRSGRTRVAQVDYAEPPLQVPEQDQKPVAKPVEVSLNLMQKKPAINYAGMNKKQLQKKCQDEDLPKDGDADILKARHQDYITLWNAETDSIGPKSKQAIVQLVLKKERTRAEEKAKERRSGATMHTTYMKTMTQARKELGDGKEVKVVSGDARFDAEIKKGWTALMFGVYEQEKDKIPNEKGAGFSQSVNAWFRARQQISNAENVAPLDDAASASKPVVAAIEPAKAAAASRCVADCKKMNASLQANLAYGLPAGLPANGLKDDVVDLSGFTANEPTNRSRVAAMPPHKAASTTPKTPAAAKAKAAPMSQQKLTPVALKRKRSVDTTASNPKRVARMHRSLSAPWECLVCTFRNESRTYAKAKCEMCQQDRPLPSNQSSLQPTGVASSPGVH